MSVFTPEEIAYLATQRLGRLATIDPQGSLQNSPVSFRYNPATDTIDIGGRAMGKTKKFRNIQKNPHVAFVVDDVLPPWQPRCLEIRGTAQALPGGGRELYGADYRMDDSLIRISPAQIISWGMEAGGETRAEGSNRKVGRAASGAA
jgi:pyridoxamine 5'-phosphate oxidase family protein